MTIKAAAARVVDLHAEEVRLLLSAGGTTVERRAAIIALIGAAWNEGWDAYGEALTVEMVDRLAPTPTVVQ